jgi:ribosomal protein S18 acetylase RimI-like enzyme
MEIISPGKAGPELTGGINRMLAQLTGAPKTVSAEQIEAIIGSENSHLLAAVDQGQVLGMLTLVVYTIPSGKRAVIEDLVVDNAVRRRGIGRALLNRAIMRAGAMGATDVNLTSNPSRKAANRLYRKMGFEARTSNTYRLPLPTTEKPK